MSTSTSTTPTPIDIYCGECGSRNVTRDATAVWSIIAQAWKLQSVQDQGYCNDCGGETHLREAPADPSRSPDQIIESARSHDPDTAATIADLIDEPATLDATGHTPHDWTARPCGSAGGGRVWINAPRPGEGERFCTLIATVAPYDDTRGQEEADTVLILHATHAPHVCDDPTCPGNLNARKLAAYADLRDALAMIAAKAEETDGRFAASVAAVVRAALARVQ